MQSTEACQFLEKNQWVSNVVAAGSGDGAWRFLTDISAEGHRLVCELGYAEFSRRLVATLPAGLQCEGCVEFRHVSGLALDSRPQEEEGANTGILSRLSGPGLHRLLLRVGADAVYFQGHFPGNPILPGIAQLHWAAGMAMKLFGFKQAPFEVKRLKFRNIIRPSSVIELVLEGKKRDEVEFGFAGAGEVHSSGCLCFKEELTC